jgi:hypothetical protein
LQFNPLSENVVLSSDFCHLQNGYEKCAAEYQVRIKSLNEKSQAAQPKVTYEYYDEAPTAEQAYEYEADDHTHDNSTEDAISDVVSDAAKVEGDAVKVDDETKSQTPKRSRRQAAPVAPPAAEGADYVYDEAQQAEADPEENVRLLCCSFQRYLVTKDVS